MKNLLLLCFIFFGIPTFAIDVDLDLAQSSPSLKWHSIENDFVRVIYPESIQPESVYIANLVEHYSQVVGKTYGIAKPRLFNLVIRSEMGSPNGYVTLAPRRSEWFASSMFIPFVGTTEWYQTLAIHEYRHVNQFDHFNTGGTRVLYYLMGETGWQLAAGLTLPSWYLEGDAVWSETKYTDGGRGRSPRFISRLKALVLSDKIPTYDQFLSGTYQTNVPNQYVYGYALVSYAVHKFGDDVWEKITRNTAIFPYPTRFYTSFETVTGQNFAAFYNEAMQDLRTKWSTDKFTDSKWIEYRENSSPIKSSDSLYYVKKTLDTHAQLMRETNQKSEVVLEFPYNRELQVIDVRGDRAIYNEFLPDARFAHKGSSDLILADLKTGKTQKITNKERIYNPRFNLAGNKIVAVQFDANQAWSISEFDLTGQRLNHFTLPEGKVAEVYYLDDETLVVLVNNKTGNKFIGTVDLKSQKLTKILIPASRNLINSIFVDKNKSVFFEAQYKGANEIFKLSADQTLSQCTKSKLGSYSPFSDGENLYLSEEDINGSVIRSSSLSNCTALAVKDIVDFNYLGDTASDAYNKFPVQALANQESLMTNNQNKYQPKEYGDFDSSLYIPHSWGLTLGRGQGLGFKSDNYLRTLGASGFLGKDAEEGAAFTELNFDIKKYYPIFRLQLENRNRDVEDFSTANTVEWEEKAAGIAAVVPYIKKQGLNNFALTLKLEASYLDTSNYMLNEVSTGTDTNYFYKMGSGLGLIWSEDAKSRSIIAPWLVSYNVEHENADSKRDSSTSSYRTLHKAQINTPAFSDNDGLMFTFDEQKQKDNFLTYRFLPSSSAISYAFSRGFDYKDVSYFQKVTGNYVFPITYPDQNLGRWIYANRIYSTVFFDSTFVRLPTENKTLNSYGAELLLDSKVLSFLPMTFGGRVLQKLDDHKVKTEFFLATDIGF